MLVVKSATTQEEFLQLENILEKFYKTSFSKEISYKWWKLYPQGTIVLKKDNQVIGGSTFYPVSESSYSDFINGVKNESSLMIDQSNKRNWYFGDYIISKEHRSTDTLVFFINSIKNIWLYQINHDQILFPVKIASLGLTNNGKKASKAIGLTEINLSGADSLPIYEGYFTSKLILKFYLNLIGMKTKYLKAKAKVKIIIKSFFNLLLS